MPKDRYVVVARWQAVVVAVLLIAGIISGGLDYYLLAKQNERLCEYQRENRGSLVQLAGDPAQALVTILVNERVQNGAAPDSPDVQRLQRLGALYVAESRRSADSNLPSVNC